MRWISLAVGAHRQMLIALHLLRAMRQVRADVIVGDNAGSVKRHFAHLPYRFGGTETLFLGEKDVRLVPPYSNSRAPGLWPTLAKTPLKK